MALHRKIRRLLRSKKFWGLSSVLSFVVFLLFRWRVLCSPLEIKRTIDLVCKQYSEGIAHGDFCYDFCMSKVVEPVSCQAWHAGKEVVFLANYRNKRIYVKGLKADFTEAGEAAPLSWTDGGGRVVFPNVEVFKEMVKKFITHNMGFEPSEDSLRDLFNEDELTTSLMKNLWHLIQDNEYVLSKFYSHYGVFPELLGNCGGLYFVEEVTPLSIPYWERNPPLFSSFELWVKNKVEPALLILDLLEELDSIFPEPVHLCDIKISHFGKSDDGGEEERMKFLDLDSVFFKSVADRSVGDGSPCQSHHDCDFFDCYGRCDMINGTCSGEVVNDNLQIVCEKIFLGGNYPFVSKTGLLTSKHVHRKLRNVLLKCSNPSGSKDGIRIAAGSAIRTELYGLLQEIVDLSHDLS